MRGNYSYTDMSLFYMYNYLYNTLLTTVASVPTPSSPPQGDGPVLLPWHWIVIAVSIAAAIFFVCATIIVVITYYACRKQKAPTQTNLEVSSEIIMHDIKDVY